jgi:hypothetical protein
MTELSEQLIDGFALPLLPPLPFALPGFPELTGARVAGLRGSDKYLHTNLTIASDVIGSCFYVEVRHPVAFDAYTSHPSSRAL